MSENEKRYSQWTVETLKQYHDALRMADKELAAERDRRYTERDQARSTALDAALHSIEKSTDILASSYRSDKAQSNEWRGAINDVISKLGGTKEGANDLWKIIASVVGVAITVGSLLFALLH